MILLDSDHLTVLQVPSGERRQRLVSRMALAVQETIGTTIVSVEEQMRGWLASIAKERTVSRQPRAYRELQKLFAFFAKFPITEFDDAAATKFEELRRAKVRIGTPDLKIASVTLVHNALLLTANKKDYEQVPGLRFENWLD